MGLISRKKGRNKTILIPKLLNEKQSLFLLHKWIIKSLKKKSNNFFFNIVSELNKDISKSKKSSFFLKEKKKLYNQLLKNIYNLKKRSFYKKKKIKSKKNFHK
jgi:hypothetical protein